MNDFMASECKKGCIKQLKRKNGGEGEAEKTRENEIYKISWGFSSLQIYRAKRAVSYMLTGGLETVLCHLRRRRWRPTRTQAITNHSSVRDKNLKFQTIPVE